MPGSPSRLLPADLCVAAYGIVLGAAWAPFAASSATARGYLVLHAALLLIPLVLNAAGSLARAPTLLREAYPLLLLAGFWPELGAHFQVAGGISHDAVVASLDQVLFGGQPSLTWSRLAPAWWIRDLMNAAYLAYYLVLIAVPASILRSGRREAVRELVLYVCVVYLGCFLVYATYPVVGPFHFFGVAGADHLAGPLEHIEALIRSAGDSLGTAFPSSHVAGGVCFALLASRWCPRWAGQACWAVAALVCVAVVYTHHHYLVDALGGLALALAAHAGILLARRTAQRAPLEPLSVRARAGAAAPGAPAAA